MTKEQEAEVRQLKVEVTELEMQVEEKKQRIKAIKADEPPAGTIQKGAVRRLNRSDTRSAGGPFGKFRK